MPQSSSLFNSVLSSATGDICAGADVSSSQVYACKITEAPGFPAAHNRCCSSTGLLCCGEQLGLQLFQLPMISTPLPCPNPGSRFLPSDHLLRPPHILSQWYVEHLVKCTSLPCSSLIPLKPEALRDKHGSQFIFRIPVYPCRF